MTDSGGDDEMLISPKIKNKTGNRISGFTIHDSGYGVGLVIERSRVRIPAGALPGSLGQLSLPSLRGR